MIHEKEMLKGFGGGFRPPGNVVEIVVTHRAQTS